MVAFASTIASLLFAAATMRWMRTKCRWWEVLLLLAATFILFRPDWFADRLAPEYTDAPASQFFEVAANLDEGDRLVFVIAGQTLEGEERNKTVALRMGPKVEDANPTVAARKRLADAGINVSGMGEMLQVTSVRFGSTAAKARIEQGFEIVGVKVPTDRINAHWFYIPGLLLAALPCSAEVAVSILAEMIQARYRSGSGEALRGREGRIHRQRPGEADV